MKRITHLLTLAAMGIMLNVQLVMADVVSTTQPQAPAVASPLSQFLTPGAAAPAGHPDVSQLQGQSGAAALPPGHPNLPAGQSNQAPLPAGHPGIGTAALPTTPSTVDGTLTIRAVQKTPGGAAVGSDPVAIEIYVKGQLLTQSTAQLNTAGTLQVPGLPASYGVQAVVKVTHAGAVYAAASEIIDAQHPQQSLDVPVYETVEKAPDWSVTMRHVIVHPSPAGLDVTEMIAVQMPGDRAWIGTPDAAGKRTTLSLKLPEGVQDAKVGASLAIEATTFEGGVLSTSQAIMPGENRYEVEYTIPARDNKASVSIAAPVKMGHVLVFVPEDGTAVTPAAPLQLMGVQQGEKGAKTRYFMATQVAAGKTLSLSISDLNAARAADNAAATDASQAEGDGADAPAGERPANTVAPSMAPRMLLAVGAGLVLVIGAGLLLIKHPRAAAGKKK